jgi:uncharacterized protein
MPKSYFSAIFGSSPIKPLQAHMSKVLECAKALDPLFEAVAQRDYAAVDQAQERVAALEDEADDLKKALRLELPSTLFLPVDRRDLLEQLRAQDKIANKAKDIAGLVRGRKMYLPEPMKEPFKAYLQRCIDASEQALNTVNEMDELVETGFRGSEVELVHGMLHELSKIEKDTDNMQIGLRAQLHKLEPELPPVDVMFLYKILEWTGDLADAAEKVGSRLQLMLAK